MLQQLTTDITDWSEYSWEEQVRKPGLWPDVDDLCKLMGLLRRIFFAGFFAPADLSEEASLAQVRQNILQAEAILREQICRGLICGAEGEADSPEVEAEQKTAAFFRQLPAIRRLLLTDVEAIAMRDPAVSSYGEIILAYPSIRAMLHHRVAHALVGLSVPLIPRIIAEYAHSMTGIDIHPAATIGTHFSIDHGTGVVIGATARIGNHVMLYQGVTLGARNFKLSADGRPQDFPRHPILEDRITVYSNASILGRVTIGHDTVIGGNVWVTSDVPPYSRILQTKPIMQQGFSDGTGI